MYVYMFRWPVIHRNVAATSRNASVDEKSGSERATACPKLFLQMITLVSCAG